MSTRVLKIAVSSVPRTVPTGYGPDTADTVAVGTTEGVVRAGGIPVILPVVDAVTASAQIDECDGLILSGGHDLALPLPEGESVTDRWIDPARDVHELALWSAARTRGLPVLGICRGAQLVNHALGGALARQIDDHDAAEAHAEEMHEVSLAPGTRLYAICGPSPAAVNTIHHQAVERPGDGLVVSARSVTDGSIEGIEAAAADHWFVGVQWHPELMAGHPAGDGLFRALVEAAAKGPAREAASDSP